MKKIRFSEHIFPHLIAIGTFLLVTVFFFSPAFLENKILEQYDIQQFTGSAKTIQDYRDATGEEALWAGAMFSGMPAYLISVRWGNEAVAYVKRFMALGLPHPISSIFLAFVCYYIMLLAFRIRPYLAIAGAISFGLSSYMIIGLIAGHNGRIGAIAFMPLVVAGIHLVVTNKRILGTGLTAAAVALQLRENHIQITYYLFIVIAIYALIYLIEAVNNNTIANYVKSIGILAVAALLGAGTFFGQFWAMSEYSSYSTRGKSDLVGSSPQQNTADSKGISKEYAFEYSNGLLEPLIILIPNFYGGATSDYLIQNPTSQTYKALASSGDDQMVSQIGRYTSAYWGPQYDTTSGTAPYYGGAIVVFLFAIGIVFAEKKYVWWLASAALVGIVLSWGKNFSLNYFLFDYLPGYDKFRSVTFTLIIVLFSMPLLGLLGLERLWSIGLTKEAKRKLLIVFGATGGLCLLIALFAGLFPLTNDGETQLPLWLLDALKEDRQSLLRNDAFRSFAFIFALLILIYFDFHKRISPVGFYVLLTVMVTIDLTAVDKRYLTKDRFKRKRENTVAAMTEADRAILADKAYYRVYNLSFLEAKTSYHHYSIGGYHGAKLRRYQEFYDSCLQRQTQEFIIRAQKGDMNMQPFGAFNMLNVKYIVYGTERKNVIPSRSANGNGWFVQKIVKVKSAAEELEQVCSIDTQTTAVIDVSKFDVSINTADTIRGTVSLLQHTPRKLKYTSQTSKDGLAVFSEIYYPEGWLATIDGKEVPILRANYILRALEVPAGNHTIQFMFEPKSYLVGNKITTASSWLVLLILVGSVGWTLKENLKD